MAGEALRGGVDIGLFTVNGNDYLWKSISRKSGKLDFKDYAVPSDPDHTFKKPMRSGPMSVEFGDMVPLSGRVELKKKDEVASFVLGDPQSSTEKYDKNDNSSLYYNEGPFYIEEVNVDDKIDDLSEAKTTIQGTGTNRLTNTGT